MKNKLILSSLGASAIFLGSCGDKRASGGVSTSVIIASLQSSSSLLTSGFAPKELAFADVIKSTTNFSYGKLDGLKVTIKEIRGSDKNSGNPLTTMTINEEIELTDDPDAAVALNETGDWAIGDYRGIELRLANSFKIKAYCKTELVGTAYTQVYTTAAGVTTRSCANDAACATAPTDYDYYSYAELDNYYTVNGGDPSLQSNFNFSIAAGSTPKLKLLFDAVNTAACWNGEGFNTLPDNTSLGRFRGPSTLSERQSQWPDGSAAFAVPVLPIIAYLTTDEEEANPTARTFLGSDDSSDISSAANIAANLGNATTMTILYNAAGEPISGGTRNSYGSEDLLSDNLESFTANTTAGYDFFASGWFYHPTTSTTPQFIRNRKIVGFNPGAVGTAFSASVEAGDDCGQTLEDHNGDNPSKTCTLSSSTHHFVELVR